MSFKTFQKKAVEKEPLPKMAPTSVESLILLVRVLKFYHNSTDGVDEKFSNVLMKSLERYPYSQYTKRFCYVPNNFNSIHERKTLHQLSKSRLSTRLLFGNGKVFSTLTMIITWLKNNQDPWSMRRYCRCLQ